MLFAKFDIRICLFLVIIGTTVCVIISVVLNENYSPEKYTRSTNATKEPVSHNIKQMYKEISFKFNECVNGFKSSLDKICRDAGFIEDVPQKLKLLLNDVLRKTVKVIKAKSKKGYEVVRSSEEIDRNDINSKITQNESSYVEEEGRKSFSVPPWEKMAEERNERFNLKKDQKSDKSPNRLRKTSSEEEQYNYDQHEHDLKVDAFLKGNVNKYESDEHR